MREAPCLGRGCEVRVAIQTGETKEEGTWIIGMFTFRKHIFIGEF
jgi:hypothetical protein